MPLFAERTIEEESDIPPLKKGVGLSSEESGMPMRQNRTVLSRWEFSTTLEGLSIKKKAAPKWNVRVAMVQACPYWRGWGVVKKLLTPREDRIAC